MKANFTPSQSEYKNLGAFQFWCQKIMPMVYDDSLSYYELLNKVVLYLNDVIFNVNAAGENTTNLYSAYVELQNYVNHYFDNLDVQNEINTKLDSMAENGSLSVLIQPMFDEYKHTIDAKIEKHNKDIVENNENASRRIGTLENRVNELTRLPDGSTTGDAEIADARVDFLGNAHDNLGAAIRTTTEMIASGDILKTNGVQARSVDFVEKTCNLFDKTDVRIKKNCYITNNGVYNNDASTLVTHPIHMVAGVEYKWLHCTVVGQNRVVARVDYETMNILEYEVAIASDEYDLFVPTKTGYYVVNLLERTIHTAMVCTTLQYPENYVSHMNTLNMHTKADKLVGKITAGQADFIEQSENLFNKNDSNNIIGQYINRTNTFIDDDLSNTTHPIYLEKGKTYKYKHRTSHFGNVAKIGRLSNDEIIVENSSIPIEDGYVLFTPNYDAYYIISYYAADVDDFMVCLSDEYPKQYVPYHLKLSNIILFNQAQKDELNKINVLTGKSITFNGDSICATPNGGYGAIIAKRNNMVYQNVAVGGGTITSEQYTSSGVAKHWISRTISKMNADADYAILEGGVNDSASGVPMGEISNGYSEVLDDTTFCGAFESMLKQLITRFAGKKVGYIAVHKMTKNFNSNNVNNGESYYLAAKQCCEKWGVPFLDLNVAVPAFAYFSEDGDPSLSNLRTTYTQGGDGWHPTEEGHKKFYCDKIEAWLKTL